MQGRTYRYLKEDPLYPFGYGLSYTNFIIENAHLNKKNIVPGENIKLSLNIENTGNYDGDEVIQIYVRKVDDQNGPLKSLKAFNRIHLKRGQRKSMEVELPSASFETFDSSVEEMRVLPGNYEVLYGKSSADKDLKKIDLIIEK